MNQNNLENILKNKAFAEKIIKLQTPEEVQSAFKEKEIEISIEEVKLLGSVINKMIEKRSTDLSGKDLEEVAGGTNWFHEGLKLSAKEYYNTILGEPEFGRFYNLGWIAGDVVITSGIIGTVVGLSYVVPWAYKKVKTALNLNPSKK